MFEGDFEFATFARSERRRTRKDGASIAQNDLVKLVKKLDGDLGIAQRHGAGIDGFSGEGGDFLLKKIFGAFQQVGLRARGNGVPGTVSGDIEIERDAKCHRGDEESEPRKTRGRPLVVGSFERESFRHSDENESITGQR